ncbi:hypothetical protein MFRU_023g00330 [Monilinia fructicola]|uniref:Uncharacterized protein n=1 Tax=Monilinia fructicola TaxID=38448 RepID=A0A5M9K619_MONFR|nr:hypothetical protein EYC84_007089 [Monilinia fructicola]KAG4028196.1 hypothetical protein MFRU_023g00330 [Monilinia fructicola]
MISMILYLFGLNKTPKNPRPKDFTKTNRLQKEAPFINDLPTDQVSPHRIFSEVLTDFRVQSCLTLVQEEDETIGDDDGNNDVANACAGRDLKGLKETEHEQHSLTTQSRTTVRQEKHPPRIQDNINFNHNLVHRIPSNYSISIYSSEEIYPTENMESLRRRAKTPVFFIGQLERKAMENDPSEYLANEYRTVLPRRRVASYMDLHIPLNPAKRTLRKIKSQESLRDLCKSYATSPSTVSDCETLVGSDGGSSPRGSIFKDDGKDDSFEFKDVAPPAYEPTGKTSVSDEDISLQICSDLLTSKLTATLCPGHSKDQGSKVSSLEILLMIEAYESIRKELRSDSREDHVISAAETALDQWLHALYTIYEDCHGIRYSSQRVWNSKKQYNPVSTFAGHHNQHTLPDGFGHGNPRPIELRT